MYIQLLVHRCDKCVEIKRVYVEKQQSSFISVTLKSWSGRKLLDPTTYIDMRVESPKKYKNADQSTKESKSAMFMTG